MRNLVESTPDVRVPRVLLRWVGHFFVGSGCSGVPALALPRRVRRAHPTRLPRSPAFRPRLRCPASLRTTPSWRQCRRAAEAASLLLRCSHPKLESIPIMMLGNGLQPSFDSTPREVDHELGDFARQVAVPCCGPRETSEHPRSQRPVRG
jgi:hypothetical protein